MLGVSRCDLWAPRALAQPIRASASPPRATVGLTARSLHRPSSIVMSTVRGWRGQAYRAGRAVECASHTTIRSARPPAASGTASSFPAAAVGLRDLDFEELAGRDGGVRARHAQHRVHAGL